MLLFQRYGANDFVLGPFAVLSSLSNFSEDCKYLHDFVNNYVQKALVRCDAGRTRTEADKSYSEQGNERYVLLYELVKQTRNSLQLRSEILSLLVAG